MNRGAWQATDMGLQRVRNVQAQTHTYGEKLRSYFTHLLMLINVHQLCCELLCILLKFSIYIHLYLPM